MSERRRRDGGTTLGQCMRNGEEEGWSNVLNRVYRVGMGLPCKGCGRCRNNPDCLPNARGKGSLWSCEHKEPKVRRRVDGLPAGLKNLGATCYMNALLQYLFMNTRLRGGIYQWTTEGAEYEKSLSYLLRLLFARLQATKRPHVDPSAITELLKIKTAVQQDATEFTKLFLNHLEEQMAHGPASVQNLVRDIFVGRLAYVTTCKGCHRTAGSSLDEMPFHELEVNVKGIKSLEEGLRDFLKKEELTGDNQYQCFHCESKQDAERRVELRHVPDVLLVQLKRFVFDVSKGNKRKVTDSFSFPHVLDMSSFVHGDESDSCKYDLSAAFNHMGTSTHMGHYVAHIRDEKRGGKWYEFDDMEVSYLDESRVGKVKITEKAENRNSKNDTSKNNNNNNNNNNGSVEQKSETRRYTSQSAYMLIYTRRGHHTSVEDPQPTREFLDIVERENADFEREIETQRKEMEEQEAIRLARREEVVDIMGRAPAANDTEFFWISSEWLLAWARNEEAPEMIHNSDLLCRHNKLSIEKVNHVKRISGNAWHALKSHYGADYELSQDAMCLECVKEMMEERRNLELERKARCEIQQEIDKFDGIADQGVYICRSFLMEWKKTAGQKKGDLVNVTNANEGICCRHGRLRPGARKKLIPIMMWTRICDLFPYTTPFLTESEACTTCSTENTARQIAARTRRTETDTEKRRLKGVYEGHISLLDDDNVSERSFFMVSGVWLRLWRLFIEDCETHNAPPAFSNADLFCAHHKLLYDPSLLRYTGDPLPFQLLNRAEWDYLLKNYCRAEDTAPDKITITLTIVPKGVDKQLAHPFQTFLTAWEATRVPLCGVDQWDTLVHTFPDICRDCSAERAKEEEKRDSHIMIEIVKEARTSRPSRSTRKSNERHKIHCKMDDRLHDVKLIICQECETMPLLQRLSFEGRLLDKDAHTLHSYGITSGTMIQMRIRKESDVSDDDLVMLNGLSHEEGFRGTALVAKANEDLDGEGMSDHHESRKHGVEPGEPTAKRHCHHG